MPEVTIYTTPTCQYCGLAKEFFQENNVEYQEKDVAVDFDARQEMIEATGQLGVPVITIGEKVVIGYNEEALRNALNIK